MKEYAYVAAVYALGAIATYALQHAIHWLFYATMATVVIVGEYIYTKSR